MSSEVSGGYCEGLFPDTVCWTRLRNAWKTPKACFTWFPHLRLQQRQLSLKDMVSRARVVCAGIPTAHDPTTPSTLRERERERERAHSLRNARIKVILGDRFLSSAGAGGNCARPMRLPDPSPVLDKNRAPMGPPPEILSSTGAGVWRKAPMALPDSNSVLEKFESAISSN